MLEHTDLPFCFTRRNIPTTTHSRIKRGLQNGHILLLKKGCYMFSSTYLHEPDKIHLTEFVASQLYAPSYISVEYVLRQCALLKSDSPMHLTSVTTKTNRLFENSLARYSYSNLKSSLFFGFEERFFRGQAYLVATKGKALFDYFYLRPGLALRNRKTLRRQIMEELGFVWTNFSEEDFKEFDQYVWKSNSAKMMKIWHVLDEYFSGKKFDAWAQELLR